ncbi:M20 family metallopeptidase [Tepidibacter aestuarii]|uniref:M20 family metallopeptidase n=1 Tax=Tepidibacter aestuarii TaxID=2925782 RepID=UPI0020BF346B|nr:M20 family metallopeptidase [Tepidibacter aestuarii]CAH2213468.1 p-aminobenzoyl-glutamate hydrolase subunit B [Tepidibacter aestuarii]
MKNDIFSIVDSKAELIKDVGKKIWENPELGYKEKFASSLLKETLKDAGFLIKEVEGIPTAFIAEYGSGSPIIGILGEYDALPSLSQKVSTVKESVIENGNGHGCGHNLIGVGGVGACLSVKEMIEKGELSGTIRFYGCPAEELLSGKTFMAQKGVFDDLDTALTWHPFSFNGVCGFSTNAMLSAEFFFKGVSSHAGQEPEKGRSALDAVELMNVGTNYLREHIIDGARMHYTITNGGVAPNIVPAEASVWYYVRAPKKSDVYDIFDRLVKVSQGAALMTETEVEYKIKADCYNVLNNRTLEELLSKNMKEAGKVGFTEEDKEFAEKLVQTIPENVYKKELNKLGLKEGTYIDERALGVTGKGIVMGGSTDVGDVSYKVPTAQFGTACIPVGVAGHSWQATSSFGSELGLKGAVYASKVLAGSLYDLLSDGKDILDKAKEEFKEVSEEYQTRLPKEFKND